MSVRDSWSWQLSNDSIENSSVTTDSRHAATALAAAAADTATSWPFTHLWKHLETGSKLAAGCNGIYTCLYSLAQSIPLSQTQQMVSC